MIETSKGGMHVAGAHSGQRVRHAALRVVVAVDADRHVERGDDRGGRRLDLVRERRAVGVAQRHPGRPGLGGGARAAQGVLLVVAPGVEEVLGVVDDGLPLAYEERDGVGDHREVLVAADPHDLLEMQAPRLADERADRCERVGEQAQRLVVLRGDVAPPRHPERGDLRGPERLARQQLEQLRLLGVGGGEAGFDQRDAELVEDVRDAHLLLGRERHPLPLHSVAQGAVVDGDAAHVAGAGVSTTSSHSA
jgi:hypothetical protein